MKNRNKVTALLSESSVYFPVRTESLFFPFLFLPFLLLLLTHQASYWTSTKSQPETESINLIRNVKVYCRIEEKESLTGRCEDKGKEANSIKSELGGEQSEAPRGLVKNSRDDVTWTIIKNKLACINNNYQAYTQWVEDEFGSFEYCQGKLIVGQINKICSTPGV